MKSTIFFISFIILLVVACTKETDNEKQLNYDDFKNFLTSQMDYNAIVEEFGQPDKDIGSGIHIYVYELKDSTEIWIGYTDQILYARHVDKNQNVLHTITENDSVVLTYDFFNQNLNSQMDYNTIVEVFGEPIKDIGSGIHIYVYVLDDSTEIWIGYTNQILYAKHVDKNQNVLHIIIEINSTALTYEYFKNNLNSQMDYNAIVEEFGQPIKDIGSGIHIYVYELDDSTEIWIGYTDQILYARHVDKNQQLLDTLI